MSRVLFRVLLGVLLCPMLFSSASALPSLRLPWTSGELWQCTCDYGCGLHTDASNAYYSLDFGKIGYSDGGPDQPVLAVAAGTVVFAGLNDGYGYCVKIDHGDGYVSMYAHLRYNPTISGSVQQGQQIGVMGGTSTSGTKSYTDHIHFMIYYSGSCRSNVPNSKPEPMSGYSNFTEGLNYTSDNNGGGTYVAAYVPNTQTPTDPSGVLHLTPNEVVTCSFTFANNGTAYWSNNGSSDHYVELHSVNATATADLASNLAWNWLPAGPTVKIASTTAGTVNPGTSAVFSFTIKTPATLGCYTLYVAVYHPHSGTYISASGPTIPIQVQNAHPAIHAAYDFDADGLSDVWDRTSTGEWHIDFSSNGFNGWEPLNLLGYGSNLDIPCPADYDNDGYCDIAVLWNSDRTWRIDYYAKGCGFGGFDETYGGYGQSPDYPLPADYDGDGKADLAVRTADGYWRIDKSSNGFNGWDVNEPNRGGTIDTPSCGDFDGDGKADLAVLRNSDRKFLIDYAANGWSSWDRTDLGGYGGSGDTPCPADYDGDGVTDVAVRAAVDRCIRIDYAAGGFNGWQSSMCGYGGSGDPIRSGRYDSDLLDDVVVYYAQDGQLCVDKASDGFGGWHQCYGGYPTWKPGPYDPPDDDATFQFAFTVDQPIHTAPATLHYVLPEPAAVSLRIYDITGRSVATLVDRDETKGEHLATWRSSGNASGIYFARLTAGTHTATQRVLLLK